MRNRLLPIVIVLLLSAVLPARGWYVIGHYLSALEASKLRSDVPSGIERYANLPDYHDNKQFVWYVVKFINTPQFCWSHGLVSSGSYGGITLTNANDGREPGAVMAELLRSKISTNVFADEGTKLAAKNTINGFLAHNAADAIVHFNFYPQSSTTNWIVHHGFKEIYAEYLLLKEKAFSGDGAAMFDNYGCVNRLHFAAESLLNTTDTALGIPYLTDSPRETDMTARMMCLSQRVLQKNRGLWREGWAVNSTYVADDVARITKDLNKAEALQNYFADWTSEGVYVTGTYWQRAPWAVWEPLITPTYSYQVSNGSVAVTTYTTNGPPANLRMEYQQLCGWYAWSQQTQSPGSAQRWDDAAIKQRYDDSVVAIKNAIRSGEDLNPQNP